MKKEDVIRKLTSRKLWLAVAALVSGLILAFGGKESTAQTVSGVILQAAAVVGYIIGEGMSDAAGAAGAVVVQEIAPEKLPFMAGPGVEDQDGK